MTHCGRCGCHRVAGQGRGGEEGGQQFGNFPRNPLPGMTPLWARRAGVVRATVAVAALAVQEQLPSEGGGAEALLHRLTDILGAVIFS